MRSAPLPSLALAAAALLAYSCSHAPPPATPGAPTSGAPATPPPGPGDTAPGSVPGQQPGTAPEAPPPPSGPPASPSASPVADYHEIMKLYRANLSEDFIIQQIRSERRVYHLTADDVIALRDAGVSERVIQAMLDSGKTAVEMRPIPEDVDTVRAPPSRTLPAAGSSGFAPPREAGSIEWDGLARRQDGPVLFHGRWHVGALTLADGQLRWVDAKDASRNLLIPVDAVAEQFLTCLKRPGGNECFEWGIRTKSGETYRFRDVAWEQGVDSRPLDVHEALKSRFPSLIDSERDVDEKAN